MGSVLLPFDISCDAHVAKSLICNTLFSLRTVWACLTLAWLTYVWEACLKNWMWRPSEEGDNWDTWGPLLFHPGLYTPERRQTEALQNRVGGSVNVPLDKAMRFSNHLSSNNQQRGCFPTNSTQLSPSPFVNTELQKTKVWSTANDSRLGKFPFSEHCSWRIIVLLVVNRYGGFKILSELYNHWYRKPVAVRKPSNSATKASFAQFIQRIYEDRCFCGLK